MKHILYTIIAITLITSSCKNRKEQKREKVQVTEVKEAPEVLESPVNVEVESESVVYLEEEDRVDLVIISLSKTVCFGACPAYSAQFYKDGTVLYEGIKDVQNIGSFKGKVEVNQMNEILNRANSLGYFKLDDSYDNENVSDLPTATTLINYKGMRKKVICRFECDPAVIEVNKFIEETLSQIDFKKIDQ